jgi:hypothetical protein
MERIELKKDVSGVYRNGKLITKSKYNSSYKPQPGDIEVLPGNLGRSPVIRIFDGGKWPASPTRLKTAKDVPPSLRSIAQTVTTTGTGRSAKVTRKPLGQPDVSFGEGLKINVNKLTQPSAWTNPKNSVLEGTESNKNRLQLKTSETAGAFGSYLTIGKPPTSDTTTSSRKDGKPFDPNTLEIGDSKEIQQRFTQRRATDPKPPGKLYSDVHTIDPNTGKPLGVMTRAQRRKWEDNNQKVLQEALKNKEKPRDYYNRGQLTLSAYG